jgi:hypothetical protein
VITEKAAHLHFGAGVLRIARYAWSAASHSTGCRGEDRPEACGLVATVSSTLPTSTP